jgi:hypothetical protein
VAETALFDKQSNDRKRRNNLAIAYHDSQCVDLALGLKKRNLLGAGLYFGKGCTYSTACKLAANDVNTGHGSSCREHVSERISIFRPPPAVLIIDSTSQGWFRSAGTCSASGNAWKSEFWFSAGAAYFLCSYVYYGQTVNLLPVAG